jgi:hypothetical protein
VGRAESDDFPVTKGCFQKKHARGESFFTNHDVFLTKVLLGPPKILTASVSGKKLIVTGGNFKEGAAILVDGQKQKTANDGTDPSGRLIAKKTGKRLVAGIPVMLQVRNPDGELSIAFPFTR